MKYAVFLCAILFALPFSSAAQKAKSDYEPPFRMYYNNDTLHIIPANRYAIVSYSVSLLRRRTGTLAGPAEYKINRASKSAIDLMKDARSGDKLYFEDIGVVDLSDSLRGPRRAVDVEVTIP